MYSFYSLLSLIYAIVCRHLYLVVGKGGVERAVLERTLGKEADNPSRWKGKRTERVILGRSHEEKVVKFLMERGRGY